MRALAIAATGMNAQQTNVEVIANNIANINTTGFKRARAEFTDLLYQAERAAGRANRGGEDPVPEGAQIGLGVRTAAMRNLHIQGALTQHGNKLDLALNGRGWFQVAGANGEPFYTRAGAFNKNATGQIVTADGYVVQPAITVPQNATEVIINETGQVYVRIGRNDAAAARPVDDRRLRQRGRTGAAGRQPISRNACLRPPVIGVAGDPGFGTIHQGYLENSNVDPVKEITELISAQRAYEMNSKVIQAADDMFATVAKGLR